MALGSWIAQNGHTLVYGGSRTGLMGATADAVLAGGGKVIGVSQGATTQSLIEQMIKDNGFSCKPEFRAFSGYPIIKSSLDAGNIDVFAMDRSTLAGYMNETVELLQPEVKFGEQGYGVATKKGCDLSAVVDQVICDRLADGWLDQEVKTWGLV